MGNADYSLWTTFNWLTHEDGNISVHFSQSAFTKFNAYCFYIHTLNKVPSITSYWYGYSINLIPPVDLLYPNITRKKQVYQSIIGGISCLVPCTHNTIDPALTFIAYNSNAPHQQRYKAALHIPHQSQLIWNIISFQIILNNSVLQLLYSIIMSKRFTLKPPQLTLLKSTNWPIYVILTGAVNSSAQLIMARLWNYSSFFLSLVFSFSTLLSPLLVNKSTRIRLPWTLANLKQWQILNAPQNSSPCNILPTNWEWWSLEISRKYTMKIKKSKSGSPQLNQKLLNTSISGGNCFVNAISSIMSMCFTYLASSTPVKSSPRRWMITLIIAISVIPWWFSSKPFSDTITIFPLIKTLTYYSISSDQIVAAEIEHQSGVIQTA